MLSATRRRWSCGAAIAHEAARRRPAEGAGIVVARALAGDMFRPADAQRVMSQVRIGIGSVSGAWLSRSLAGRVPAQRQVRHGFAAGVIAWLWVKPRLA